METGRTAKEFISDRIVAVAKEHLSDSDLTVKQVADRLGFEYPQHFVRFFKLHTGMTPNQFRSVS